MHSRSQTGWHEVPPRQVVYGLTDAHLL